MDASRIRHHDNIQLQESSMDAPRKGTRVHFGEIEEEDARSEGGDMIELNEPVGRNESGEEMTSGGMKGRRTRRRG